VARVIEGGNTAFSAIAFPQLNANVQSFISDNVNRAINYVGEQAGRMYERVKTLYDEYTSFDLEVIRRRARAIDANYHRPTDIVRLTALEDFANASLLMQRYIMANPTIRARYENDRCEGYFETYDPNRDRDYDNRRVTNGLLREEKGVSWFEEYYEDLEEGDRELTSLEQFDVLSTWDALEILVDTSDWDPTSPDKNPW
jgi:hypothetical protein